MKMMPIATCSHLYSRRADSPSLIIDLSGNRPVPSPSSYSPKPSSCPFLWRMHEKQICNWPCHKSFLVPKTGSALSHLTIPFFVPTSSWPCLSLLTPLPPANPTVITSIIKENFCPGRLPGYPKYTEWILIIIFVIGRSRVHLLKPCSEPTLHFFRLRLSPEPPLPFIFVPLPPTPVLLVRRDARTETASLDYPV